MSPSHTNRIVTACRRHPRETDDVFEARHDELIGLCEAAGGTVVASFTQVRPDIDAGLYLGSGKVDEIRQAVVAEEVELVVFDADLSPGQIRNLEQQLDCRVIDRTQLILDIFALRARSKEGRLQVEIAQLQYLLPRLTGRGIAMSRLGGGIGTRGPGETKLETDRRRIRKRITHLRALLKEVQRSRRTQRHQRTSAVPMVALIGYTNAGKSTLLKRWTETRGTGGVAGGQNRLFDTLDPLTRRVRSQTGAEYVLLDTVGFVQDLPHQLVEAFQSTLEDVSEASVIVHVVDGSSNPTQRMETTYKVLKELHAEDKPVITFFNKQDLTAVRPAPDVRAVTSVFGSAETGFETKTLFSAVERHLRLDVVQIGLSGPQAAELSGDIARIGRIISVSSSEEEASMVVAAVTRQWAEDDLQRYAEIHGLSIVDGVAEVES